MAPSRNTLALSSSSKRFKAAQRTKARKAKIPTQVRLGKQAFPKQLFNTVKYAEGVAFTVTAGTGLGKYLMSCNGLFDPNFTGSGHQPLYFDQLMLIYDHYTVLRSRCKVTLMTAGNFPLLLTLIIDDDASSPSTAAQCLETMEEVSWCGDSQAGIIPPLRISWDAAKHFGPNPQAQDSLQGTSGANPLEASYFAFNVQDFSVVGFTAQAIFEIEYDVVWDEYATIAQS